MNGRYDIQLRTLYTEKKTNAKLFVLTAIISYRHIFESLTFSDTSAFIYDQRKGWNNYKRSCFIH